MGIIFSSFYILEIDISRNYPQKDLGVLRGDF